MMVNGIRRFHCTGKVNIGLITNVVSHSCAVQTALTTDPGMGRVSQLVPL